MHHVYMLLHIKTQFSDKDFLLLSTHTIHQASIYNHNVIVYSFMHFLLFPTIQYSNNPLLTLLNSPLLDWNPLLHSSAALLPGGVVRRVYRRLCLALGPWGAIVASVSPLGGLAIANAIHF